MVEIVTDDMPFLVDSVTMELSRRGYAIDLVIHPVIRVRRDEQGRLIEVLEPGAGEPATRSASRCCTLEVDREPDAAALERAATATSSACWPRSRAAVEDWQPMRGADARR